MILNDIKNFRTVWAGIGENVNLVFVPGKNNMVGRVAISTCVKGTPVPNLSLEDILQKNRINEYSLVSDIEGAEISFLIHNPASLRNCKELIIELHETYYNKQKFSIENLINSINDLGFSIKKRDGAVLYASKFDDSSIKYNKENE